jgi:hypothetical protein
LREGLKWKYFFDILPWAHAKCKISKKIATKSPTPHFSCGGTPKKLMSFKWILANKVLKNRNDDLISLIK